MYIFPINEVEESDRIDLITNPIDQKKTLVLKTYGLPMIFWGYLAACLTVIGAMWLAIHAVIEKILTYQDPTLIFLGLLVKYTLILSPIVLLGFFFYEKKIHKSGLILKIVYKVFFIPIAFKTIKMDDSSALVVDHFMDSPNMAKIHSKAELKGFENKGYFELHAKSGGKNIFIDRHSRKIDLEKMKDLLSRY